MAVAFDAASESHTGTTGSQSEASFSWTHTPSGTPKGVLVFTITSDLTGDIISAVTYGGTSMTAVTGGLATDAAVEGGHTKAWFLGSSVPTGAQTVQVTRTNNTDVAYAVAITVTASADTEPTGVVLLEGDQALAEQNVNDGSPGTNSLRFAATLAGGNNVPAAGATSTAVSLHSIALGPRTLSTVRESTAGQGSRPVGFSEGVSDDVAAVHLAIREVAAGGGVTSTPDAGAAVLTGQGASLGFQIGMPAEL
jgi:hypothetical protein